MPKELTHWILADRSLAGLEDTSRLAGIIRTHRSLYLAGAVLPDTLLHLFRGPDSPQALLLAHLFHDPADNSYLPLIRAAEQFADDLPDPLLACLLGVLSHMQGDAVFHPFVFALAGTDDIGRHYRLETAIDLHLLHQGALSPVQRLAELVDADTRTVLAEALILLFDPGRTLPYPAITRALDLHCRFQAMYLRRCWRMVARLLGCLPVPLFRRKQHLFYPLFGIGGEIPGQGGWRHPATGQWQRTELSDLAEEAVARTLSLFRRIERHGLTAALADPPGENLLTGLPGIQRQRLAP